MTMEFADLRCFDNSSTIPQPTPASNETDMLLSHSAIWKSAFIATTAAVILAFALPTRNQTGLRGPTFGDRQLLAGSKVPKPVLTTFQRSCQDCHSANTNWPWYSRIPPVSWKIHEDVAQGRKFMDLSKWDTYTDGERSGFLLAIVTATQSHTMPPPKYVWMHTTAKLSDAELHSIRSWALAERSVMQRAKRSRNTDQPSDLAPTKKTSSTGTSAVQGIF